MRVLIAFDKFKDSLTAPEACAITADALRARHPDWTFDACPLADGGEGFCSILTRAAGGELLPATVTGPRATPAQAAIGLVPLARIPATARALLDLPSEPQSSAAAGGANGPVIAVIEMAAASGLALLPQSDRDPWQATTVGTGELIQLAIARGAAAILLGVGGSATHDLGLGALTALGLAFTTSAGATVQPPVPARWSELAAIRGRVAPTVPPIRIACDVTNPLVGPNGAAATYGPQKGLQPEDFPRLDRESARLARLLCAHCGQPETLMTVPGAGAAGGIAFGLMTAAGARLLPGFDLVAAWLDVEARLAQADLLITGEGRFDDSSLQGKGPGAVAARALALGKPVHVFAGRATATHPPAGLALHSITPAGLALPEALARAPQLLTRSVQSTFGLTRE